MWNMISIKGGQSCEFLLERKSPRESFFRKIRHDFEEYENLIMCGDWNFVTESLDQLGPDGPTEPEYHPETCAF